MPAKSGPCLPSDCRIGSFRAHTRGNWCSEPLMAVLPSLFPLSLFPVPFLLRVAPRPPALVPSVPFSFRIFLRQKGKTLSPSRATLRLCDNITTLIPSQPPQQTSSHPVALLSFSSLITVDFGYCHILFDILLFAPRFPRAFGLLPSLRNLLRFDQVAPSAFITQPQQGLVPIAESPFFTLVCACDPRK